MADKRTARGLLHRQGALQHHVNDDASGSKRCSFPGFAVLFKPVVVAA